MLWRFVLTFIMSILNTSLPNTRLLSYLPWVVSSNLTPTIQHCLIKFVSDLRQVGGFLRYSGSSTNKTDCPDITEILLKVALNTINHKAKPHLLYFQWYMNNEYTIETKEILAIIVIQPKQFYSYVVITNMDGVYFI